MPIRYKKKNKTKHLHPIHFLIKVIPLYTSFIFLIVWYGWLVKTWGRGSEINDRPKRQIRFALMYEFKWAGNTLSICYLFWRKERKKMKVKRLNGNWVCFGVKTTTATFIEKRRKCGYTDVLSVDRLKVRKR